MNHIAFYNVGAPTMKGLAILCSYRQWHYSTMDGPPLHRLDGPKGKPQILVYGMRYNVLIHLFFMRYHEPFEDCDTDYSTVRNLIPILKGVSLPFVLIFWHG